MKSKFFFFALLTFFLLTNCKDDDQVGSIVQPSGDRLSTFSNMAGVSSACILVDSVLSKSDYFFLGEYSDSRFGTIRSEFISQIDSRVSGLHLPDTTVTSSSSPSLGILSDLLTNFDSNYGSIESIYAPENFRVDSVFFLIQYANDFFGDSTALQAVSIYALNKTLSSSDKYYTNTDVAKFCKKDTLLGYKAYQIQNSREIRVPLNMEFGKRLADIYRNGSSITTQTQFNEFFKGIYAAHTFNQGGMIKINVTGILLYYSYDAQIKTTYQGKEVTVSSADLKNPDGSRFNPLVSSAFLSANNSIERINIVSSVGLKEKLSAMQNDKQATYTYTPSGLYTNVEIPFDVIFDSIRAYNEGLNDYASKLYLNSIKLKLYTQELNWDTKLSKTPSNYMLLIPQDSIVPFFRDNKVPDDLHAFLAAYDATNKCYTFDLTKSMQKKLTGKTSPLNENMVIVPTVVSQNNNVYYYTQELWLTATMFYGAESSAEEKRPRIDMIYTTRE